MSSKMSNIRRRNQGTAEKDPYDSEPFMKRDKTKVFANVFDNDEDDLPPASNTKLEDTGDPLWDDYRIKPYLSNEDKVEILMVRFGKSPKQIAELLGIDTDSVQIYITVIQDSLRSIGKVLEREDNELARGLAIRQLELYLQEINEAIAQTQDTKLMAPRATLIGKLITLKNLDVDKKAEKSVTEDCDAFDAAIDKLDPSQATELYSRLKSSR